jgi:hypothetical protein
VLVVASEDYTGLSPNKTPYATGPRYLDEHVAALQANGYAVETYDVDNPPAGPDGEAGSKLVNDLGVLSHFDAVVFYTGDDLVPQEVGEGVTNENYRRGGAPDATGGFNLTGSTHLTNWGVRNAHMLRNYMNDGGKVLLSGRNVWVQQTNVARSSRTQGGPAEECFGGGGLNSYSNYSWWQDPVYGFNYPPNQAGDDDRPHTAFFRELDMPNDWGQWWLGTGTRCEGVGRTNLASTSVVPSGTGLLAGMPTFALDTSVAAGGGVEPTQDPVTGLPDPRLKVPTRLRPISTQTTQRPLRQEQEDADYTGVPNDLGAAIISTRDSVSVGFGLEQVTDTAARSELVRRMMAHLLPAGADTAAPTVSWLRPGEGATVNAADPVEIEVEAVDERGDVREVRLSIGGRLVQRKVSFPFQMRWYPSAADVGRTATLVVEAEDKAGNVTTSTRTITVGSAQSVEEAPLPTGATTIAGRPVVGRTLTCIPSGFSGNGVRLSYQWLRNGAAIAGATREAYVPVAADIGRGVSCRVTATNSAGNADSTSEALIVSAAAARKVRVTIRVTCKLTKKKDVVCVVRRDDARRWVKATIRVVGSKGRATARGRGRARVRLDTRSRVRRGDRVEVRYASGGVQGRTVVRLGRSVTLKAVPR